MTVEVSAEYLDGIREGRDFAKRYGVADARDHLDTLNRLCRLFEASSPVGQTYRGERDFWRNQIRKHGREPTLTASR